MSNSSVMEMPKYKRIDFHIPQYRSDMILALERLVKPHEREDLRDKTYVALRGMYIGIRTRRGI